MKQQVTILCPVCRSPSEFALPVPNWGEMRLCTGCGLRFAHPLTVPQGYYDEDASGALHLVRVKGLTKAQMVQMSRRLLPSEYHLAAQALARLFKPQDAILDLGCGVGYFLALLEAYRFHPVGLEISKPLVETLREKGFDVLSGSARDWPPAIPEPKAVTMFHVLEHVVDPLGLLSEIYHGFPNAMLVLGLPYPGSWHVRLFGRWSWDFPPYHLTEWEPPTAVRALERVGYRNIEFVSYSIDGRQVFAALVAALSDRFHLGPSTSSSSGQQHERRLRLSRFVRMVRPAFFGLHDLARDTSPFWAAPAARLLNQRKAHPGTLLILARG
jgi:SAM-dependent methyltransferase